MAMFYSIIRASKDIHEEFTRVNSISQINTELY